MTQILTLNLLIVYIQKYESTSTNFLLKLRRYSVYIRFFSRKASSSNRGNHERSSLTQISFLLLSLPSPLNIIYNLRNYAKAITNGLPGSVPINNFQLSPFGVVIPSSRRRSRRNRDHPFSFTPFGPHLDYLYTSKRMKERTAKKKKGRRGEEEEKRALF